MPMMWFEGSWRIAAPQSVKRGLRRVKGLVGAKQWAWLLEMGVVVVVRLFSGWMRVGERFDVGGRARARARRAVGANAASIRRSTYGVFIVHGFCFCAQP